MMYKKRQPLLSRGGIWQKEKGNPCEKGSRF